MQITMEKKMRNSATRVTSIDNHERNDAIF